MSEPIDIWLAELRRRGHDVGDSFVDVGGRIDVVVDDEARTFPQIQELLRVPDAHFVGEGGALPAQLSLGDLKQRAAQLDAKAGDSSQTGGTQTNANLDRSSISDVTNLRIVRRDVVEDPNLLLQAVLTKTVGKATEGDLIIAIVPAWRRLLHELQRNPQFIHQMDPRKVEELIAAAYEQDGFEVVLTPRSGDNGCDVIATKHGFGSVRVIDQVKAYSPGRRVKADDVRALIGTMTTMPSVSKGVVTTTADFAPRIRENPLLMPYMPTRLELRDLQDLCAWFDRLLKKS